MRQSEIHTPTHVVVQQLRRLIDDQQGLETVEYAIIAGLMVIGILAAISAIGLWVRGIFQSVQSTLSA